MARREVVILCLVLAAVEGLLWWRLLPLPHADFGAHVEPAWWFAHDGSLRAPASQYKDLTYRQGSWFYPPGQFLVLGSWIRLLGWSDDSLLGYTHTVHGLWLGSLWMLLRLRLKASQAASGLALAAVFPVYHHGRPDLLAALLTVWAWLAANRSAPLAGVLVGATLLSSPGFGVAAAASIGVVLVNAGGWRRAATAAAAAAIFVTAVLAILLPDAPSREFALRQFETNAILRGATLNRMPDLLIPYALLFCTIPLGITVAFALAEMLRTGRDPLRIAAWAFAAGFLVWYLTNKAQLLYMHHFLLPAKAVFLGALAARRPRIGVPAAALTAAIALYWAKADFVYAARPLRAEAAAARLAHPRGGEPAAVDGLHMTTHYRAGDTVFHEVMFENSWREFRDRGLLPRAADGPLVPEKRYVSALALYRFPVPGTPLPPALRLFGRPVQLPAEPFAIRVIR